MKIRLNFVALRSDHLPEEGRDEIELGDGARLTDALVKIDLAEDTTYMTLVNEASVPSSQRASTPLEDGDTVTIFSPIKGG